MERDQVARYLRRWKEQRYNLGGIVLPDVDADAIKERILDTLSVTDIDFVLGVLRKMVSPPSKMDTETDRFHHLFLGMKPERKPALVHLIEIGVSNGNANALFGVLTTFFMKVVTALAEVIPKKAATLSKAELAYRKELAVIERTTMAKWVELRTDDIMVAKLGLVQYRSLLVAIMQSIRAEFRVAYVEDDSPPIEFPGKDLVSKYAEPVLYYSASFVIGRCKMAKSVAERDRVPYRIFAETHLISTAEAKEDNLPTRLVEEREGISGSFSRCSRGAYQLMRKVESFFLAYLTLEMMIAYPEGDLIVKIGEAILRDETIRSDFFALAEEAEIADGAEEIFVYIMNIFIGMRGRWFVRTIKGQESKKSVFSKAATRKMVANAADVSKARGEREMPVYVAAETNILDGASEETDDSIEEEGMGIDLTDSNA